MAPLNRRVFMKKPLILALVCLGASLPVMRGALAAASSTQDFVRRVSVSDQFEISAGRMALQSAESEEVRAFAQRMVDDHTNTANQLKSITSSSHIQQSQPTPALDSKHRNVLDRLREARPEDFDRHYMDTQVDAHKKAVSLFRAYAKNGEHEELRNFATKTLPALEDHLRQAQDVRRRL